ncbi:Plexin-C1 [Cricetulus griseus]|uniref:Plexin-C1 n=1 Tax=Cricetulus griseus TaxID=10029 RepID=G3HYN2_CRIGR|nr:Plexin-C1 [Cricetulus griseus]
MSSMSSADSASLLTTKSSNFIVSYRDTAIALKNTEERSLATQELGRLKLRGSAGSLHFVDAFLWNGSVYFPYYPYNYTSGAATGWPSMARIAQSTEVLFQGQAALDCSHGHPDGRRLLLSSSLVEAMDVWAGVFSAATGEGQERRSPATTALCLFRMSEIQARARSCSWDFQATEHNCTTVTIVGSFSAKHSECVVKNADTGKLLCQGRSQLNRTCACNIPSRQSYSNALCRTSCSWQHSCSDETGLAALLLSGSREGEIHLQGSLPEGGPIATRFRSRFSGFLLSTDQQVTPASGLHGNTSELCHVTVEKLPKASGGGGGVRENQSNRINQSSKVFYIKAIEPQKISTLGKSNVIVTGANFTQASNITMILSGTSTCDKDVIRVSHVLNDTHMKFSLPSSRKEMKDVCIQFDGGTCSSAGALSYIALPHCSLIVPATTWISGGQNITIMGRNFDVIDNLIISHELKGNINVSEYCTATFCRFLAPNLKSSKVRTNVAVKLRVQDTYLDCGTLQYLEDPRFTGYRVESEIDTELEVKIQKENDNFNISKDDIDITLFHGENKQFNCSFENITRNQDLTTILCKIKSIKNANSIATSSKKVRVKLGNLELYVEQESVPSTWYFLIALPVLLAIVIVVAVVVTRHKSKELSRKQSQQLELLESELRKEIRDGFAELQMDKLDVVDSFGTVPFLDYKHFALRTFFPENRDANDKNESLTALDALICNKSFLVTVIHTLEKQKNFSVKDRCLFASFLTIALQTKLVYLTSILEVLTRDLMEQCSNMQPKLMLRRTESVVEKLLTNWMSVCLSGFLRETVGEPFYLLVTTLNQKINKGPVDVITCKALYTLNEDWLLWQVPEFNTVALNVVFEKIPENESADVCRNISVNVLDCDTIGQAKDKIFQAFLSKNGSPYGLQLNEIGLELQVGTRQKELLDIDSSSVILEDGITKLNTIGHYEISNGSTIKVFKKIANFTSDVEYSDDHCHLILPDSEAFQVVQGKRHRGKHKFKVKEMYLTKLLSTKVAIHSVLEKLFRSIWSLPNSRAPFAIKYFFDFLDAQAENKKITDPDVVHIWKTNSLPLRFWVNILKNPQFVFDIKKTPHIDSCLSVIAQAFMDAFSLTEQQLGKPPAPYLWPCCLPTR